MEAHKCFCVYKERHVAAFKIQRKVRSWLFKLKLKALLQNKNTECVDSLSEGKKILSSTNLFSGFSFVMCGAVPKRGKKSLTQVQLKQAIVQHGGRVKEKLPGSLKGNSTKLYTVLADKGVSKKGKVPVLIIAALRNGCDVLDYSFVLQSLNNKELEDKSTHEIDLKHLSVGVSEKIHLRKKHFNRSKTMISVLKVKRSKPWRPGVECVKKPRCKPLSNAAVYYAVKQREALKQRKQMSFSESRQIFAHFMKEFKSLTAQ